MSGDVVLTDAEREAVMAGVAAGPDIADSWRPVMRAVERILAYRIAALTQDRDDWRSAAGDRDEWMHRAGLWKRANAESVRERDEARADLARLEGQVRALADIADDVHIASTHAESGVCHGDNDGCEGGPRQIDNEMADRIYDRIRRTLAADRGPQAAPTRDDSATGREGGEQ